MASHQKNSFELPYAGIDQHNGLSLLYGLRGDYSVIFKIQNPVLQYAADPDGYNSYHSLLLNLVKILGEGYIIQKQDVFCRKQYKAKPAAEFLQEKYHEHFEGREYTAIYTYLIITRQIKRNAFYVFDHKALNEFKQSVLKTNDLLSGAGLQPFLLEEKDIQQYVKRILGMSFSSDLITLDNLLSLDQELKMGGRTIRSISLIDTDLIDLPEQVATYTEKQEGQTKSTLPVDNFSFLHTVPGYDCIIFNQVLEIPQQRVTLNKLELKRKRHSGVPDPANNLCVEDIDQLLADVARDNQLLVNAHFNIMVCAQDDRISRAANYIEAALFQQGIIPSKNAYNQMELYRSVLPGNAVELQKYDWFLTTSDAALCFFFKEALLTDDPSDFLVRFTDRQGIPVAIDPSDLPMRQNRISARNRFCLGPSGSGKSYFINSLTEQYLLYNMDVVIVDTGHSYSGLCSYYKGKYITYTDKKPITMNPFQITEAEYNIEKKDFLVTLVSLLWKGAEGIVTAVERDVISNVISSYYNYAFEEEDYPFCFNTFYEFALKKIPQIKQEEHIPFDVDEFRYVLKKFFLGGEFQSILNEAADESLFTERFIVFEIDSIKENRILFPIVTLIIMDVFIQKMRYRSDHRKCLIVEEAWKAIASPLMAGYLLYLYKTVRKFWGEAIVVTQELGDILGNAVVKDSILSNSDTIMLLDQSRFKDNYQEIAKLLSLSETEQKKIFTINQLDNKDGRGKFKEVYIRRGNTGEVYGVEVSIFQYLTYTTEKPEKSAVEKYVAIFHDYPAALTAFVNDLQISGLKLEAFVKQVNKHGPLSQNAA
ncbi:TraG family conjugative transposon ATPase [Mucilaginibacter sp. FT3.2]|uniref:TraG family conjugative transposon ATPase n=1 Tax=Mucilaginibacter sp. FT3.2 TaxID=2723090 RepID=UPI0016193DAC|nr:TraG family conjugative transposon ATPase [Mucilaginibacter sp. FT3.2]MBB6232466.1 conjugation system TraG family ATPase [Mucilaginibacter sp. FT3.2]